MPYIRISTLGALDPQDSLNKFKNQFANASDKKGGAHITACKPDATREGLWCLEVHGKMSTGQQAIAARTCC